MIANPGLRDFRDPKVFPNEVLGGWSMVLAAGDALLFYHSDDLLRWEKTGTFGRAENRMGGIFECPDLFALPAPNGKTLWVLTASMGLPAIEGGGKMQYFLGEFDGRVFQQTILAAEPLLLDAGQDNYAAVTFFGAEPTQIGWAGNWAYAARIPAANWRGCMTLARRLSLAQTRQGLRLAAQPVLPALRTLGEVKGAARLPGETFVLDLKAQGDFEAAFSNGAGERLAFGCDGGVFFIDRESTGHLPYPRAEQPRLMEGPIHMRAVFDRSVIEIFADGGVYAGSALVFPAQPYDALELRGATGMLQV